MTKEPTILAIPIFVLSMAIEGYVLYRERRPYDPRDTAASLSGGMGYLVVKILTKPLWFAVMAFVYDHRLFTMGTSLPALVALLFSEDLTYYAYHRASHEIRFLWAAHVAHHSSQRYTLGTALRQSWTAPFVHAFFVLPLPLVGFRPELVALMNSLSLLYQYWIHTETIRSLGPFEMVLNTPSHHRVHHGSNAEYIDRNHGGIFIVWDRLFGTFEPEVAKVRYGLTKNLETTNWLVVQTHEFLAIARDLARARSVREAWHALTFMPPRAVAPAPAGEAA